MKCGKAMAHLCIQSMEISPTLLGEKLEMHDPRGSRSYFIHDAFMAGRDAWDQLKMAKTKDDHQTSSADIRTALRTMVVHGLRNRLSRPDNEKIIRDGDLRWCHNDGQIPSFEEFDRLIDYLVDKLDSTGDDATQGDALLALSAMNGLGSDAKRASYIEALIRCMAPTRPTRVRCAAVRAISDAREELASIAGDSMPHGVDAQLLDNLFTALSTALGQHYDLTFDCRSPSHFCYSRLMFSLTKNDEWCQRLTHNGHVQQCTGLFPSTPESNFYIAGISLHIDISGNDPSLSFVQDMWGLLTREAWPGLYFIISADREFRDCLEVLPALVTATKQHLPGSGNGVASLELQDLSRYVCLVLQELEKHDGLNGNVLSVVRSFSGHLKHMLEPSNTT